MSLRTGNDRAMEPTEPWQFEKMASNDLVDVIFDMDDNAAKKLLFVIAAAAQMEVKFPDREPNRFAVRTWERFKPVIQKWAAEKAELAAEQKGMS